MTEAKTSLSRLPSDLAVWLGFAAAPTFALMAAISATGSAGITICTSVTSLLPISEMALMYLLMAVFHLSPWVTLLFNCFAPSNRQPEGD